MRAKSVYVYERLRSNLLSSSLRSADLVLLVSFEVSSSSNQMFSHLLACGRWVEVAMISITLENVADFP